MFKFARIAAAALLLYLSPAVAFACNLLALPITTAVTAQVSPVLRSRDGTVPRNATIQCNLTYGSGGTTIDAWVQTSFDGGATWNDMANCHYGTSGGRFQYNLSAATPVTTEYTPTDGTLSPNTSKDGLLGTQFRVKYTTVGTYAGGTNLSIDLAGLRLAP
jgi:hypothetical protein